MTIRQKAWLIARIILKRLRFMAILAAVALLVGYWDTIRNYWDKWVRPPAVASRELPLGEQFICPMHPDVVRPGYEPNGDVPKCPICHMPLAIHEKPKPEPLPPGVTGRVQISPERIHMAGIRTVRVEYRPLHQRITTVGSVRFDEGRLSKWSAACRATWRNCTSIGPSPPSAKATPWPSCTAPISTAPLRRCSWTPRGALGPTCWPAPASGWNSSASARRRSTPSSPPARPALGC